MLSWHGTSSILGIVLWFTRQEIPRAAKMHDISMTACAFGAFNSPKMLPVCRRHAPKLPYDVDYTLQYDPPKAASNEDEGSCAQTLCAKEGTGTLRIGARSRTYGHDMYLPDKDSSAIALKLVKTCEEHEAAQARYKGLFKALQSLQPLLQELADDAEVSLPAFSVLTHGRAVRRGCCGFACPKVSGPSRLLHTAI